mgnify:CR=1 FL=1
MFLSLNITEDWLDVAVREPVVVDRCTKVIKSDDPVLRLSAVESRDGSVLC